VLPEPRPGLQRELQPGAHQLVPVENLVQAGLLQPEVRQLVPVEILVHSG
jgi:hypothetical protein